MGTSSITKGAKAIGNKWVFKIKCNENGEISKFKARLVAQGFSQRYGVDYDEVFAPVVKQATIRTLLTIAGENNLLVKQFDFKTAFLNGDIKETIYMKQPKGFVIDGEKEKVCKLNKSLYGLKQAAKWWNDKINSIIVKIGFIQSDADPCLFIKGEGKTIIYLVIYCDRDFSKANK